MSIRAFPRSRSAAGRIHAEPGFGARAAADEDFRQLRHQTKNTLQRLLMLIGDAPELQGSATAELRDSLQHQILASADLSDVLFGFRKAPGALRDRLRQLCTTMVDLMAEQAARINVEIFADEACPPPLHDTIVRVAHELVGNALKHGMYQRLLGTITLCVRSTDEATTLVVTDDGWGYAAAHRGSGEGLSLIEMLLEPFDGTLQIARRCDRTEATVTMGATMAETATVVMRAGACDSGGTVATLRGSASAGRRHAAG